MNYRVAKYDEILELTRTDGKCGESGKTLGCPSCCITEQVRFLQSHSKNLTLVNNSINFQNLKCEVNKFCRIYLKSPSFVYLFVIVAVFFFLLLFWFVSFCYFHIFCFKQYKNVHNLVKYNFLENSCLEEKMACRSRFPVFPKKLVIFLRYHQFQFLANQLDGGWVKIKGQSLLR